MSDRHFDQLATRFAEKIYGGAKGAIRLAVLQADLAENRPDRTEELVFDSSLKLSRGWSAQLSNRFDLVEDRASRVAAGLVFRNECLAVDLSLSRRFTSSTSVTPTTEFGLSVELLGFGGGSEGGAARQCRG